MTTQTLPAAQASREEQEAAARLDLLSATADHLEAALRELGEYRRAQSETTPAGQNRTLSHLPPVACERGVRAA